MTVKSKKSIENRKPGYKKRSMMAELVASKVRRITSSDDRGIAVGDVLEAGGIVGRAVRLKDDCIVVRRLFGKEAEKYKKVKSRHARFTGHAAKSGVEAKVIPLSGVGMVIGELDAVCYTTVRDGETESYKHEFRKKSRPMLVSSADGKNLYIVGGSYHFGARGIVDK